MKKLFLYVVLSLLWCNISLAKIYHLKCTYDDGSGNVKIFIDTERKLVRSSNEVREEEYTIYYESGEPTFIRAIKKGTVSTLELNEDSRKEPKGDLRIYSTQIDVLDIDLWGIVNNQSNRAKMSNFYSTLYFYIDEKNKERIFMPTEKEFQLSSRGKELDYYLTQEVIGHHFHFNCLKN